MYQNLLTQKQGYETRAWWFLERCWKEGDTIRKETKMILL